MADNNQQGKHQTGKDPKHQQGSKGSQQGQQGHGTGSQRSNEGNRDQKKRESE